MPRGVASPSWAVTTVTPEGNPLIIARNSSALAVACGAEGGVRMAGSVIVRSLSASRRSTRMPWGESW